jgi:hypothetical protein
MMLRIHAICVFASSYVNDDDDDDDDELEVAVAEVERPADAGDLDYEALIASAEQLLANADDDDDDPVAPPRKGREIKPRPHYAAEELRKLGYTVVMMPEEYRKHLVVPSDDFLEAWIAWMPRVVWVSWGAFTGDQRGRIAERLWRYGVKVIGSSSPASTIIPPHSGQRAIARRCDRSSASAKPARYSGVRQAMPRRSISSFAARA